MTDQPIMDATTPDPFVEWDAAYVLGALSAEDRRAFEAHLATCDRCTDAVLELTALPGLLAHVDPADLTDAPAATDTDATQPDTPPAGGPDRPAVDLAAERRRRRGRRWLAGLVAAAVALVAGVTVPIVVIRSSAPPSAGASSSRVAPISTVTFNRTTQTPVRASAAILDEPWGTRIDTTCTWEGYAGSGAVWPYQLYAVGTDGSKRPVASWTAGPGMTVEATGTIQVPYNQILRLEVAKPDGTVLLSADVH